MTGDRTWQTWLELDDPSATLRPDVAAPVETIASRLADEPVQELSFSETLGQGGMGLVRLAEQPRMARVVAVKSLRTPREDHAARLLREAWVTGGLQHPNIVPIYDIAVDGHGMPHILMKRISGIEWASVITDAEAVAERFGSGDLLGWNLQILVQVCNAVAYAHSRGVLHRDLKPENVMIGEFGEVVVVDWGIATRIEDDGDARIAGTPRFLAPEMIEGRHAGGRTDVFLLGGILHVVLTGRAPHQGSSVQEILEAIPTFEPELGPDVPEPLAAIATRALQADPQARYADVEAFRSDLATYLEQRATLALCERAEQALGQLEQALDEADRMAVYAELAACRFGFTQALQAMPDNARAREGWQRALEGVMRFELDQGHPSAAQALLPDLPEPRPELVAAIEAAVEAYAVEARRLRELALDADLNIGARTRVYSIIEFGTLWALFSLVGWWWWGVPPITAQIAVALGSSVFIIAYTWWAQRSLFATIANRITIGLMIASTITHALLGFLVLVSGGTPSELITMSMFMFGVLSAAGAIAVARETWPVPLTFVVAAFASALMPEHGLLWMAGSLVVFTLHVVRLWLPDLPDAPVYRPED